MIGGVTPERVTVPVPNGPAAPDELAPMRTMGCVDVVTVILVAPVYVCWAFVTNVPVMVLVIVPVPLITPLRVAVPAPLTARLPLLVTGPLTFTAPCAVHGQVALLLVTSEPMVKPAVALGDW